MGFKALTGCCHGYRALRKKLTLLCAQFIKLVRYIDCCIDKGLERKKEGERETGPLEGRVQHCKGLGAGQWVCTLRRQCLRCPCDPARRLQKRFRLSVWASEPSKASIQHTCWLNWKILSLTKFTEWHLASRSPATLRIDRSREMLISR